MQRRLRSPKTERTPLRHPLETIFPTDPDTMAKTLLHLITSAMVVAAAAAQAPRTADPVLHESRPAALGKSAGGTITRVTEVTTRSGV